jgi:sensor histidine kinase YesM
MPAARLERLRETLSGDEGADPFDGTSGIGLFNVHSRLKMAYPGDETIGVSVPKSDATGTHIVITIPYGRNARV